MNAKPEVVSPERSESQSDALAGVQATSRPVVSPLHVLYLGRRHPLKGVKYLEEAVRQTAWSSPKPWSAASRSSQPTEPPPGEPTSSNTPTPASTSRAIATGAKRSASECWLRRSRRSWNSPQMCQAYLWKRIRHGKGVLNHIAAV